MSRKEEALLMSLQHAVDMALGSPEVGAVNFNLLNAVLQVMIHELKLDECSVQIRGPDIELLKMLSLTAHPSLSVKLTDYEISYNPWIDHKISQSRQQKESFDLNIFGFTEKKPQSTKKEPPPKPAELERKWKIVIVEPKTDSARKRPDNIVGQPQVVLPITDDRFTQLESEMCELKQQMKAIREMPFISDIVQIVKTLSEQNPDHAPALTQASDLWHNLKTNNRLDATEAGIEKVTNTLDVFMNEVTEALYVLTETSSNLQKYAANRIEAQNVQSDKESQKSESNVRAPRPSIFQNLVERLNVIEARLDDLPTELLLAQANVPAAVELAEHTSDTDMNEQLDAMKKPIAELERFMAEVLKRLDGLRFCDEMYVDLNKMKIKVDKLSDDQEALSTELKASVNQLEDDTNCRIDELTKYVMHLDTLVQQIAEKTNAIYAHVLSIFQTDEEGVSLALLYKNVLKFREDARKLSKVTKEFIMTEKSRILMTEALLEQVEIIKTIKADKEDVEEALMTKVDSEYVDHAVETKVSNDELHEACRKISETFDKVRAEFQSQEEKWLRSIDEIRNEVLDTESVVAELKPFRTAVYKMFGEFEKNLQELHLARIEHETAVAKKNVMRNLDCIACDNPVYMKKENEHSLFPSPPTVSGKPSMKPILTFDLESVRKHQHKVYECINNRFTDKPVRDHTGEKHARKCGGRHTITTARERLPIDGNFFDQWGDRIKPPNETLMVGTDNKVYKSSASLESVSPREGTSGIQPVHNMPFSVKRCPMHSTRSTQQKLEKVIPRMPASRHINQPIPDQEAIEEKFIAALDLTAIEQEKEEHARTGNQTELSSEGNNTDTSGSTSEEEEAVLLSVMEENDDVEEKTSDTVLQEQIKMKRNLRKMVAEKQQENIESAAKDTTTSFQSNRFDDDSDIRIPKIQPKKRVVIKEIDKDDLLPSTRSQNETQNVKPETEGPAPLKSALKKTASGQSANGAKQSGVVKKVRFAGSVSFNTGRRLGSINQSDKQANRQ